MMCVIRWPKLICSAVGLNPNLSPGMASIAPRILFCDRGKSMRTEVATGSFVVAAGLGMTADFGAAVGLAGFAAGISCAGSRGNRPEARRTKSARACFMAKSPRVVPSIPLQRSRLWLDDGNVAAKDQCSQRAGETGPEPGLEPSMAWRLPA